MADTRHPESRPEPLCADPIVVQAEGFRVVRCSSSSLYDTIRRAGFSCAHVRINRSVALADGFRLSVARDDSNVCFARLEPIRAQTKLLLGIPIDLNGASATDLAHLDGVGPKLAAQIVRHRSRRGRFRSISELIGVHGLGPRMLARVRPYLYIN